MTPQNEGSWREQSRMWRAATVAPTLVLLLALPGCGGGADRDTPIAAANAPAAAAASPPQDFKAAEEAPAGATTSTVASE